MVGVWRYGLASPYCLYLLYTIVLDYSLWWVAQIFAYEGYTYSVDLFGAVWSYGLIFFLVFLNQRFLSPEGVSGLFGRVFFAFFFVPSLIFFMRGHPQYLRAGLLALSYAWLIFVIHFFKSVRIPLFQGGTALGYYGTVGLLSACTYGMLLFTYGVKWNFSLSAVYEIRSEFLHSLPFPLGYLAIWQGNIINPLLFYQSLERRRFLFTVGIVLLQMYLFSVTGMKIFLFSLLFAAFIARFSRNLEKILPLALTAGVAGSCFAYLFLNDFWLIGIFVRRTLFTPGQLTFEYFDFFSQNPLIYLSDSLLKEFLSYPYPLPPPLMIGIRYYDGGSANVGIVGNAYMHFGIAGVFFFLALAAVFITFLDSLASAKGARRNLVIAAAATPTISLINSGFFTVLLTHGFLLTLIMAFLLKGRGPKVA